MFLLMEMFAFRISLDVCVDVEAYFCVDKEVYIVEKFMMY